MTLIMAFLVCLPIAGAIAAIYDKKIEEGIPVAMFIATFITYLCGLFGILTVSPIVVGVLATVCLGVSIWGIIKKSALHNFFTFGGILYIILGAYYALVAKGRMVSEQDDLQVYAKCVADFYHTGKVYRFDYIPGMMMWEYLSECFWRVFSDSILFLAVAMMCVGMMLAIFSVREKRSRLFYAFVTMFVVLLPLMYKVRDVYFVLQNDFVLGVTVAYIVCMYQKARHYNDVFYEYAVYLGLFFLTITKATGLILGCIIILMFVGIDLVSEGKKISLTDTVFVIKAIMSIVAARVSWLLFAKISGGAEKYSHFSRLLYGLIISKWYYVTGFVVVLVLILCFIKWIVDNKKFNVFVFAVVFGSLATSAFAVYRMEPEIRKDAIINFLNTIFSIYAPSREFGFGYRFLIPYALLFLFLLLVWRILDTVAREDDKDIKFSLTNRVVVLLNAGFVTFAAFVFLSNVYTRNPSQVARAKECERYLYAYVVAYLLICIYQFIHINVLPQRLHRVLLIFTSMMMLIIANTGGIITQIFAQDNYYNFDGLNYVDIQENDVFFYVDQTGELDYSRFNYNISPATMINYYFSDMMVDGYWLGNDEKDRYLTDTEWNELLKSCTYVYVASTNDDFKKLYGNFFEDDIIDGHIYNVVVNGNDAKLVSIQY